MKENLALLRRSTTLLRRSTTLLQFLGMGLIWGSSFLFMKVALNGVSFTQIAWSRVILGALVLGVFMLIGRHKLPREPVIWWHFTVIANFNCIIPHLLFARAEQHVSSSLAAIYNSITRSRPPSRRRLANPQPCAPQLFDTISKLSTPVARSASVSTVGTPHMPNPPTAMLLPERMSATAFSAESTVLSIPANGRPAVDRDVDEGSAGVS